MQHYSPGGVGPSMPAHLVQGVPTYLMQPPGVHPLSGPMNHGGSPMNGNGLPVAGPRQALKAPPAPRALTMPKHLAATEVGRTAEELERRRLRSERKEAERGTAPLLGHSRDSKIVAAAASIRTKSGTM